MKHRIAFETLFAVLGIVLSLMTVATVHAETKTIELDPGFANGLGVEDVAVNPTTNRIYTANAASNNVSVIDGSTHAVIENIAVGSGPSNIEINLATNNIYVSNEDDDTITVIDGFSGTVAATINVGSTPDIMVVNDSANRIYLLNADNSTLTVINGFTNTVEETIEVGDTEDVYGPTGMDINRSTNRVYVVNMDSSDVFVIDADPVSEDFNTVIATISPGFEGWGVLFVAVNEAADRVYILNGGYWFSDSWCDNANVAVIDSETNSLITNIPLSGAYWADDPTVNEHTGYLYIRDGEEERIVIIDGSTNTLDQTVSLPAGIENIEVNESTDRIYVASESCSMTVLDGDPSSQTFHQVIAQDGYISSNSIAVNEVTNRIYAALSEIAVLVFDGTTNTSSQLIMTGRTCFNLSFDNVNKRIWGAHLSTEGIRLVDAATSNVTALDLGALVFDILFNPNTNRAYAASVGLSSLTLKVIKGDTLNVEDEIPFTDDIFGWAMNRQTNRLYVVEGNQVNVIEGNPASPDFNEVIATVEVGYNSSGMAINENTNFIYLGQESEDDEPSDIYVIDGATNTLATTITVGLSADKLAINETTNRVYTSNDGSHSISVIDVDPLSENFHTVIDTIPLASNPENLIASEATNRLYVNVDGDSTLVVIDTNTNIIETVIPLSEDSEEIQFAQNSSLRRIYGIDEAMSVVYIIDGNPASAQFNTIMETVNVGRAPSSPVVDETSHRIYVTNTADNTITVISEELGPRTMPWIPLLLLND